LKNLINAPVLAAVLVMSACTVRAQQPTTDQPYELKGEIPSTTTLKQFKKNHKHSDCWNKTANLTTCRVYDGVSFAGSIATTFKGCVELHCMAEGIFADFVNDIMVSLTYGVVDGDGILPALKAKYGEPTREGNSFVWKNSVGRLYVGTSGLTTSITSSLNDKGENKDI
jgi:hypothetical protein